MRSTVAETTSKVVNCGANAFRGSSEINFDEVKRGREKNEDPIFSFLIFSKKVFFPEKGSKLTVES